MVIHISYYSKMLLDCEKDRWDSTRYRFYFDNYNSTNLHDLMDKTKTGKWDKIGSENKLTMRWLSMLH